MILYKYLIWKNFTKDIILSNSLYFPIKSQLNDPYELTHPVDTPNDFSHQSLEVCREKLFQKYGVVIIKVGAFMAEQKASLRLTEYYRRYEGHQYTDDQLKYLKYVALGNEKLAYAEALFDYVENLDDALSLYLLCLAEDLTLLYVKKDELIRLLYAKLEKTGIFSLSENPHSPTLWAYYADNHQGVMLIFDTSKDPELQKVRKVVYVEERPMITVDNISSVLLTKFKPWEHEREYRILRKQGATLYNFNDGFLTGIVLGSQISKNNKTEIISLIKEKEKPIKVYQAFTVSTSYLVHYEEIDL